MALAIREVKTNLAGRKRQAMVRFDFDDSYPVGGEPINLGMYGVRVVEHVSIEATPDYEFLYDHAHKKILAFNRTDGLQVGDTTNLSAVTGVRLLAWGT